LSVECQGDEAVGRRGISLSGVGHDGRPLGKKNTLRNRPSSESRNLRCKIIILKVERNVFIIFVKPLFAALVYINMPF
jgi:hypothetical protein